MSRESEALLAEATFVRRLAGALLRDPSLADDVSQEVMAAALQQSRPPRNWRHWLGAVTRRIAFRTRRADQLRSRHEGNAARPQVRDTERDAMDRLQMHRELTDSVMELPEPYRTAVTLRFLEGLTPRVIAKRMNTNSDVTRQRVHRGLAMLRERLDRQHGSRQAWCTALVALGLGVTPLPVMTLSLLAMTKLAVAAGLAIAGTVFVLSTTSSDPAAPTANEAAAASTPAAAQSTTAPDRNEALPAQVATPACLVHVRTRLGSPIPGAEVCCWDADGNIQRERTDRDGNAQFAASGAGGLLAVATQRVPASLTVDERDGRHELVLRDGASVGGLLLVNGQTAPPGIKLKLDIHATHTLRGVPATLQGTIDDALPQHIVTDKQGGFELSGLPEAWNGRLELPTHLWLLPESGGTRERHRSFPLEHGRRDHLVHTTQLPTIVGTAVWDDDGSPVDRPRVNTTTWFADGTRSAAISATRDGSRFLVGVCNNQPDDYLAWCEPSRRPAVSRFRMRVDAHGADGTVEVDLDQSDFDRGTVTVRLKRLPTWHFAVQDRDGAPIEHAQLLAAGELSQATDGTGRATFQGHLRHVSEVGAPGYRIGPSKPLDGDGSEASPFLFRLEPDNAITISIVDAQGRRPHVHHIEIQANGTPFAGARWAGQLDEALHGRQVRSQMAMTGGFRRTRYEATLVWPDGKDTVTLHSLEPATELQLVALDMLHNEIASKAFVAPQLGEHTEVRLEVTAPARTLTGIVTDKDLQVVHGAKVELAQLTPTGERQIMPGGTVAYRKLETDVDGRFAFTPLCAEASFRLTITAPKHVPLVKVLEATELEGENRFQLVAARRVEVTVHDEQGAEVPLRVQTELPKIDSHMTRNCTTQFEDLPDGEVTFFVQIGGARISMRHHTATSFATFVVPRPGTLAIKMASGTWPTDQPEWSQLRARIQRMDRREDAVDLRRPDDESTKPLLLLPGRYRVELLLDTRNGSSPLGRSAEVTVAPGELTTAELR